MKILYPGSFDPLTRGHLDLIERAASFADEVIVAVGENLAKTPLFSVEERLAMIRASVAHLPHVTVLPMPTTVVQMVSDQGVDVIIKGVRDGADVSSEGAQAAVNRDLGGVETLLLPARGELAHVSSTVVREMIRWGMDTSRYVPTPVAAHINDNRSNLLTSPGGAHV